MREIVLDVLGDRDIPVLGNVEFGHAGPNLPMPVGIRAGLDAQRRTLSLLEPTVGPLAMTGPVSGATRNSQPMAPAAPLGPIHALVTAAMSRSFGL
ncbi:hypothetical protein ACF05L_17650 [Streptomyces bobili]|uniref:hypothetical protein n=1 Tax=Streptomyces bobili TaxID=67280 RepID=UPI003703159E